MTAPSRNRHARHDINPEPARRSGTREAIRAPLRHARLDKRGHISAGALEVENLEKALGGRTVIGQATGILIERFDLAPDRAFGLLTRISQNKHVKLRQVAEQIVQTRTVPKT